MKFNKAQFEEAQSGGGFTKVEDGEYQAALEKFNLVKASTGSEQIVIIWRIVADSDDFANCSIRWSQTVTNKDGSDNTIGLDQLSTILKLLSEDQFNFEEFTFDGAGNISNFDEVAGGFLGSVCKIKVIGTESGGYVNYKVYINDVYDMKYQPDPTNRTIAEEITEELMDQHAEEDEGEAQIGQLVIFQAKPNTKEMVGKILLFSDETNQLMIEEEASKQPHNVGPDLVRLPKDEDALNAIRATYITNKTTEKATLLEEEILEEDTPSPKLEKGATLEFKWNDGYAKGKVHKINEDDGTVQFAVVNEQGKTVGRTVSIDDVVPF